MAREHRRRSLWLFGGGAGRRRAGGQEAVEHLPRPFADRAIVAPVEYLDAVDKDAVHTRWVADRAPAAAWQVVDVARRRYPDIVRVEQQQVGKDTLLDPTAIGDAVKPGLMAGQPPHSLRQIEHSALAHPMAEEVKPEPGIAQVHQVRAGVGQGHDPGRVSQQFGNTLVDGVEELTEKRRLQILLQAE